MGSKKKIIISGEQLSLMECQGMCEEMKVKIGFSADPRKVKIVMDYLNKGFKRAKMNGLGDDGYAMSMDIVGMIGPDGNILRNMTDKQLFYLLQDRFQHIDTDKKRRDALLKQIIRDWYKKLISPEGLLSVNII